MKDRESLVAVAVGLASVAAAVAVWLFVDAEPPRSLDAVVGLLAFVFLSLVLAANYGREETRGVEVSEPDPEPPAAVVGDSLRQALEDPSSSDRQQVVTLLRRAAVDDLSSDRTREEARKMVVEGGWTEDPRAAAVLAEAGEVDLPLRIRFQDWLMEDSAFERRAKHAVDELREGGG